MNRNKLEHDNLAPAEALQTPYAYLLILFSQKGTNIGKQLLSRYNNGSTTLIYSKKQALMK
jgi:hypothetical protein